jgi:hypothetical protein
MAGRMSAETKKALDLVKKGKTPYRAAKMTGIALSTIYRALWRAKHGKGAKAARSKRAV